MITVAGEMTAALRAEFDDLEVTIDHSVTHIRIADAEPSVLHGLLHRVDLLGLELLEVQREGPVATNWPQSPGRW